MIHVAEDQVYLKDPEVREESGTPAIVESIRAGMVMQLKQAVSADYIVARDKEIMKTVMEKLESDAASNLVVLGSAREFPDNHLPVLSFLVKAPEGLGQSFLHHNYVSALLNDVFGIQARGGCACSGVVKRIQTSHHQITI